MVPKSSFVPFPSFLENDVSQESQLRDDMHISSHRMYDYLFSTHFIVFLGHVSVRRRLDVPNLNFFICFDHKEIVIPPLQAFVYTFAKVKTNLNSQNSYWLILLEAVF